MMEMGIDRILFSIDYPFVENSPGTEWMASIPLSSEDRNKILHGNVQRLLKL
jgi:predicted TIM-barrel fold metal-dependent hydrolase